MIWLAPLLQSIRGSGCRLHQGAMMLFAAVEMSAICDQFAKDAPSPELERIEDSGIQLSWFWVKRERSLTVGFSDKPYLLLMHGDRKKYDSPYMSEDMKHAVQSFFDGWSA